MCRGNLALRTDLPRRTADVREEALVLGARALDQVCAVRAPRALTAGELGGWMVGWLETASGRTSFPRLFNSRSHDLTNQLTRQSRPNDYGAGSSPAPQSSRTGRGPAQSARGAVDMPSPAVPPWKPSEELAVWATGRLVLLRGVTGAPI